MDVWDREEHDPVSSPTCWNKVMYHEGVRVIPNDPMAATQAFALGELGWWPVDGRVYKSLMHGNVFQPGSVQPPVWAVQ